MTLSLFIFSFVNIWWITLLMVLPFGVKRVESPTPFEAAGAPQKANFFKKCVITTVLAFFITYGFHLLLLWAPISIRDGGL